MIPFNKPVITGKEQHLVNEVIQNNKFAGDGDFTKKCSEWFEENLGAKKALLTTSCTHALEMSAILAGIESGDEVIMPSYTFVSTANAFALRGAKIVFVDVKPGTMNIDEHEVNKAITSKTKAVVVVHYAGVACEMDEIMQIAETHNVVVIEDAAQGVMSTYKGKSLGTIGHIGCFSFHETKNYHCGEGGAILLNDDKYIERAEIIREKGTDRSKFFRGQIDKYSWVDIGSSYLPSEFNAAILYGQLEMASEINEARKRIWEKYYQNLKALEELGYLELPSQQPYREHNAHMFFIKTKDLSERKELISFLKKHEIASVFHYVPLHSSEAGMNLGEFHGNDNYTTQESERLLRLPLYYSLESNQIDFITDTIKNFYLKTKSYQKELTLAK